MSTVRITLVIVASAALTLAASNANSNFTVPPPGQFGIVVARYKEPLDPWAPYAANTFLYAKGNISQSSDAVQHSSFRAYTDLNNTGREGMTYLHHIVANYDSLDDVLLFSQADPFDLLAPVITNASQLVAAAQLPSGPGHGGGPTPFNPALWHDLAEWDRIDWNTTAEKKTWITPNQIATLTYANYTMGQFWEMVLGEPHPPAISAMHGGIFAVRKETVRSRPRQVYERALAEFEKANAINPEVGFFWERMWAPVFAQRYWIQEPVDP